MSITDGLREFADEFERAKWVGLAERAREIADRIDAEHGLGRTDAYIHGLQSTEYLYDRLADIEARVERIEKLLNHKGAE